MNREEAFKLSLPKWPQCCITGKKLTPEQALEIIRRTDTFFTHGYSGNNRKFIEEARRITRAVDFWDSSISYEEASDRSKKFHEAWNCVTTQYIHNSWISCSFIGGPHGWCHPDGTIYFDNNIGKYPEVEDVYEDLCIIAKEFPFVEMTVTLMDREDCEDNAESVVTMQVKDGEVTFIDTIPAYVARHKDKSHFDISTFLGVLSGNEGEISIAQLQKWADQVYKE